MGSIKRRPRNAAATQNLQDGFENLRHAFHARLESERIHLVSLSAALARAEENPTWIFEDLQLRAHRLQGGAAIFDVIDVEQAAHALEEAAVSASKSRADNTDEKVWAALVTLVHLMGGNQADSARTPLLSA
jgi:HPt (histidine-containing phosphotransfer) domain-containing protein